MKTKDWIVSFGRTVLAGPLFWGKRNHTKNQKEMPYFIIRRGRKGAGFFSNYMYVLGYIRFAMEKGYKPVVDMKNYKTLYSDSDAKKNVWNNYFEDISGVSLEEAYNSNNYILSANAPPFKYMTFSDSEYFFPNKDAVNVIYPIIRDKIRIRTDIVYEMDKEFRERIGDAQLVIGCHVRGTDMKKSLTHPIPRETKDYINEIKRILSANENQTSRIFLATDEKAICNEFRNTFGDKLWFCESLRANEGINRGIHLTQNKREHHGYLLGKEVLRDAYFLSKCNYLVCGYSNISNVAIFWNNNSYREILLLKPKTWN